MTDSPSIRWTYRRGSGAVALLGLAVGLFICGVALWWLWQLLPSEDEVPAYVTLWATLLLALFSIGVPIITNSVVSLIDRHRSSVVFAPEVRVLEITFSGSQLRLPLAEYSFQVEDGLLRVQGAAGFQLQLPIAGYRRRGGSLASDLRHSVEDQSTLPGRMSP